MLGGIFLFITAKEKVIRPHKIHYCTQKIVTRAIF